MNISDRYMLGVTGTMGSGKSYTCKQLVEIGPELGINVHYIELDKIRVQMLSKDPQYLGTRQLLVDNFGEHIQRSDTSIDRAVFRKTLFSTPANLELFKKLTHDTFADYIEQQKATGNGLFLVEWPLLCQQGFAESVDYNFLVIQCNYQRQLERLMESSDLPLEQVEIGIRAQGPISKELRLIIEEQKEQGKGQLYVFDTTNNPGKPEHANLLERIVRSIK